MENLTEKEQVIREININMAYRKYEVAKTKNKERKLMILLNTGRMNINENREQVLKLREQEKNILFKYDSEFLLLSKKLIEIEKIELLKNNDLPNYPFLVASLEEAMKSLVDEESILSAKMAEFESTKNSERISVKKSIKWN